MRFPVKCFVLVPVSFLPYIEQTENKGKIICQASAFLSFFFPTIMRNVRHRIVRTVRLALYELMLRGNLCFSNRIP